MTSQVQDSEYENVTFKRQIITAHLFVTLKYKNNYNIIADYLRVCV